MGFSHLFRTESTLANFRARFDIPLDVDVAYCHEDNIANDRRPHVVFFPLMAILDGGVRFLVDPLILRTLRFYGLCLDQLPQNFYRVVRSVSWLNDLYDLHLNQHDINFVYSLCGNERLGYYLKVRDTMVRLISCLFNSNRNSAGEFVHVNGNWLVDELTCLTSCRDVGRYLHLLYFCYLSILVITCNLFSFFFF